MSTGLGTQSQIRDVLMAGSFVALFVSAWVWGGVLQKAATFEKQAFVGLGFALTMIVLLFIFVAAALAE